MSLQQTYYINGSSLASSTAVFLDPNLTVCAPDGFYFDGGIARQQVGCNLLPQQSCPGCCQQPCSLWNVLYLFSSFTIEYVDCVSGETVQDTFTHFIDQNFCVQYGTTPVIIDGDCQLTLVQECGCCTELQTCNRWSITRIPLGGYADVSYVNCSDVTVVETFTTNQSFCVKSGTTPAVIAGTGSVGFLDCVCGD